jgi:hypothetical protein
VRERARFVEQEKAANAELDKQVIMTERMAERVRQEINAADTQLAQLVNEVRCEYEQYIFAAIHVPILLRSSGVLRDCLIRNPFQILFYCCSRSQTASLRSIVARTGADVDSKRTDIQTLVLRHFAAYGFDPIFFT